MKRFWLAVAVLFFAFLIILLVSKRTPASTYFSPSITQDKLWSLIQNWRADNNLQSYIESQKLCDLASLRLDQIRIDFSHREFYNLVRNNPSYPEQTAENLVRDYADADTTFAGWLASASHEANLRYPYTYSCLKCKGTYCVQIFSSFNPT